MRNNVYRCQPRGARIRPDDEEEGGAMTRLTDLEQTASCCDQKCYRAELKRVLLGLIVLHDL